MAHSKALTFEPKAFLARYGGCTIVKYKTGQVLFSQGEAADCLFYIESGKVSMSVVSEHGKEAVLAILEPGDLCGESCLAGPPLRFATATTMTECVLARLEKTSVVRALREGGAFMDFFITYLLSENVRLREHLIDHLFNSSEKRLARALLLLADYGKEMHNERVIPRIDQQTLAKMVGTTRARVSHFMNKFRRLGFVDYDGGDIHVHDSLLTIVLYDSPNTVRALRRADRPQVSRGGAAQRRGSGNSPKAIC
jgi:CRP-like cAMP-binding protein